MAPTIAFFGIVVSDIPTSLAFYRRVGLDISADADEQPHVEIELPGGLRLAWDSEDTIRSFDESWVPPSGGHRVALDPDGNHVELSAALPTSRASAVSGTPASSFTSRARWAWSA